MIRYHLFHPQGQRRRQRPDGEARRGRPDEAVVGDDGASPQGGVGGHETAAQDPGGSPQEAHGGRTGQPDQGARGPVRSVSATKRPKTRLRPVSRFAYLKILFSAARTKRCARRRRASPSRLPRTSRLTRRSSRRPRRSGS